MPTVRDFGARGDGKTDDTAALSHAVQRCDGQLVFRQARFQPGMNIPVSGAKRPLFGDKLVDGDRA